MFEGMVDKEKFRRWGKCFPRILFGQQWSHVESILSGPPFDGEADVLLAYYK